MNLAGPTGLDPTSRVPAETSATTSAAATASPSVNCEAATQADWQEHCSSLAPKPDADPEPTSDTLPFNEQFDFVQIFQDGEVGTDWKVTLTKVECGLKTIPKADSNPAWDGGDEVPQYVAAKPDPGNTFCILSWDWKNVGKSPESTTNAGDLVLASGERFSASSEDQDRSWTIMDTRLGVDYSASINPRGKARSLDVYQLPEGELPASVMFPMTTMVAESYFEVATE